MLARSSDRSRFASRSIHRVAAVSAGPPCGGLPESSVFWRIMGRGDDNTVGKAGSPSPVVGQDGVRHHWSRSKGATEVDEGVYAVTGEHL